MTATVIPFPVRAVNDNSPPPPPPSREVLRLGIMLDWWERELRSLIAARPDARSVDYRAWQQNMAEAQDRVTEFRGKIGRVA